ncbi:hypothetical protein GCM10027299_28290 [Larkinella ripae]
MKFPIAEGIFLLFFLVGLTLTGVGYYLFRSRQQLTKTGVATPGVVINLHRVKSNSYPLAPSIRYQTADGQQRVFHSSEGHNPPVYQVGEEVTLYYDPKAPENVHLEGDYFMIYIFGGMGLGFLLLSVWSVPECVRQIGAWLRMNL